MRTLLVPVDFSDASHAVNAQAGRLARALEASVLLLHVIEPVASYVPVGASMDVLAAPSPAGPVDTRAASRTLDAMAGKLIEQGVEARAEAVAGLAVDEILDRSAARDVEMIVMGSHGHGALYHLFSGSVVNGVLRRARCPVCIVPHGAWEGSK